VAVERLFGLSAKGVASNAPPKIDPKRLIFRITRDRAFARKKNGYFSSPPGGAQILAVQNEKNKTICRIESAGFILQLLNSSYS